MVVLQHQVLSNITGQKISVFAQQFSKHRETPLHRGRCRLTALQRRVHSRTEVLSCHIDNDGEITVLLETFLNVGHDIGAVAFEVNV